MTRLSEDAGAAQPNGGEGLQANAPNEVRPHRPTGRLVRTVTLVGLMGAGKSAIGRRLASALGAPFRDADTEIETAAALSIPEIFEKFGEPYFREGERRVIARLLEEPPHVLATGGGAFMDPQTRARLKDDAVTVWLKADLDVLAARCGRRSNRPLLKNGDPREILGKLIETRHPIYAEADLTVQSRDEPHEVVVSALLKKLDDLGAIARDLSTSETAALPADGEEAAR